MTDDPRVTPEMHKAGLAEAYRFPGGSVDVDAIYLAMDAARPAVTRNRVEAAITAYHGGDEWLTTWSDPSIKSEREYMSRALAAADRVPAVSGDRVARARARAEVIAAAHALAHGHGLSTLSSNVDRLHRAVADLEKLERTTDEMPGATGAAGVVWRGRREWISIGADEEERRVLVEDFDGEVMQWHARRGAPIAHWHRRWAEMPLPPPWKMENSGK